MTAARVIVISPRKSGTHLIQQLMVRLGYACYGEPIPPPDGRPAFSMRERVALAERFLHPAELDGLDPRRDAVELVRKTDLLWQQLCWIWQIRLAATPLSNVEASHPGRNFRVRMHPDVWASEFAATPPGMCWLFHSLDVWRTDAQFLREWTTGDGPVIILNYRDPRDALVSLVTFLSRTAGHEHLRYPESPVFGEILESIVEPTDRLTYALRDPALPLLSDYEAAISLFHHPRVCNVSFEELVGSEGGGSRAAQVAAVGRVAAAVGAEVDHAAVARTLFDRGSFTFHKGQIGAWQDAFQPSHKALFEARFGHLLEVFGYA